MPEPALPPPSSAPLARRATRGRMTGITQARAAEEPVAPPDWLQAESRPPDRPEPTGEVEDVAASEAAPAALSAEERRAWVAERTKELWQERRRAEAEPAPPHSRDASEREQLSERERLAAPRWLGQLARGALLLGLGAGLGFGVARWNGASPAPTADPVAGAPMIAAAPATSLDPSSPAAAEMEREMDLAYAATKAKRYAEARGRFAALRLRFPGHATFAVEEARCLYYLGDHSAAQRILSENIAAGRALAESHFLMGLVQLAGKNYELAQDSFRRSALADPSRPETQFLWAEGLRREGRGAEAAHRYQIAWERNQFETNEVTYRLKLWLAQITGGGMPEESTRQLDAALAAKPPAGEALVADAARALQASDFARAARRLEEARRTMEPLVFQIALRDPAFTQEAWRTEIAPFYERRP